LAMWRLDGRQSSNCSRAPAPRLVAWIIGRQDFPASAKD
jgi:hypothetical protein